MVDQSDELQERICRACDRKYKYPVLRSEATRFYCEDCMQLSPDVRGTFEQYNKRIKKLTSQLAKLEKALTESKPS